MGQSLLQKLLEYQSTKKTCQITLKVLVFHFYRMQFWDWWNLVNLSAASRCSCFYSSRSQKLKIFRQNYSPEYQLFLETKLILFHYFFQKFGSTRKGLTSNITQILCLRNYFSISRIKLLRKTYKNPCKPGLLRVAVFHEEQ